MYFIVYIYYLLANTIKIWYNILMKFRQALFWDTNIKNIDPVLHKRYIIERVLKLGDLDDYRAMRNMYSTEDVKNVILEERSDLDPRSINFWCRNFGIKESICEKKLSAKTQELFWKR